MASTQQLKSRIRSVKSTKQITKAMQIPLPTRAEGEWWANMEEVFHVD